jgi:hypothetical protein
MDECGPKTFWRFKTERTRPTPTPRELASDCSSTSRTQVTIFSRGGGYRFFVCSRLKLCLYEFFLIQTTSPPRHLGLVGAHSGGCCDGLFRLGRYFRAHEGNETRRLLLWLRDVKDLGGLLEDVRVAEICLAVVGGNVREAADESSGGEPGRRTAPAETRACRAGSELVFHGFWGNILVGSRKSLAKISGISKTA